VQALEKQLAGTNAALDEKAAALQTAQDELAATQTALAAAQDELDTYKKMFAALEGQTHASADTEGDVVVAADGVSASYTLENTSLSGNSIVFELQVGEDVVYTSEAIKPGEALAPFTLAQSLAAGTYDGFVNIKTVNKSGEVASVMQIPVRIVVGQ
jgi:Tfp pilus assembly protein FimV